jgi:preprotein translocase subunit SecA
MGPQPYRDRKLSVSLLCVFRAPLHRNDRNWKKQRKEFQDIYNLEVIVLPTQKPMARKDLTDFVYQTELSKWKAVLNESKSCFEKDNRF